MINRLTIRLFCIFSLITVLVMASFLAVRYIANTELMQSTSEQRGLEVAKRVAASVKPTIWNIYNKSYNRAYTAEFADAILDAEMDSAFVQGIKVYGNFGHLYMGKFKYRDEIRHFTTDEDDSIWSNQPHRIRYPVSQGVMTIGHVEVSYNDKAFADTLQQSLWVDITQVAIVGMLFMVSLSVVLRLALLPPMRSLQVAQQSLNALNEAVLVVNSYGHVIDSNPGYSRITGFKADDILDSPAAICSPDQPDNCIFSFAEATLQHTRHWSGDVIGHRKDGSTFPGWLTINVVDAGDGPLTDDDITYVAVLTDITEKLEAEQQLHRLAYYDTLTGAPNRHAFIQRLDEVIAQATADKSSLALLFIDLDNFKWINDSFGHDTGDRLLTEVTHRVQAQLEEKDSLYRIGGDEFTIIVPGIDDNTMLLELAESLITAINASFCVAGKRITPEASIGISTFPRDGKTARELIRRADAAMFHAKEQGRGQACFFSYRLERQRQQDQVILEGLKEAITNNEFQLYYQPKCALANGECRVVGAEALIRWQRDGQMVSPPDRFIPIAEQSTLICDIGYWVIEQACQQIAQWRTLHHTPLNIAVNLSPRQFKDAQLFSYLQNTLQKYQIRPGELELEITESAVIEDISGSVATLNRLQALGVTVAMDDFGTGYSSLAYLSQLPVQVLKIDRSFISTVPDSPENDAIIKAIFSMARALELKVVAEGVENQQQLDFLISNRCQIGQGYYFSRPLEASEFENWLKQYSAEPEILQH